MLYHINDFNGFILLAAVINEAVRSVWPLAVLQCTPFWFGNYGNLRQRGTLCGRWKHFTGISIEKKSLLWKILLHHLDRCWKVKKWNQITFWATNIKKYFSVWTLREIWTHIATERIVRIWIFFKRCVILISIQLNNMPVRKSVVCIPLSIFCVSLFQNESFCETTCHYTNRKYETFIHNSSRFIYEIINYSQWITCSPRIPSYPLYMQPIILMVEPDTNPVTWDMVLESRDTWQPRHLICGNDSGPYDIYSQIFYL